MGTTIHLSLYLFVMFYLCLAKDLRKVSIVPYISVVMTGRNDDWGGNFTDRLKFSVKSLVKNVNILKLGMEIVIVDYNPPSIAAPLSIIVDDLTREVGACSFTVATVPPEVHAALTTREKWLSYDAQLLEYVGKNTGLRVASGRFILVTNPDIVFGSELLSFLSTANLSKDAYYTLPRSNLDRPIPADIA